MFEPFQSQSPTGTGLGLAIVYRIVREHGGDIAVRSERQRGTEVRVRLPRVGLPSASTSGVTSASSVSTKAG
jgi:signal transduction histidine kinase